MAKWGFGRRSTPRSDDSTDRPAPAPATSKDNAAGSDSWWLGQAEPSKVINRRWRSPRPGSLHPRRRATDAPPPRETSAGEPAQPFDADALLREQSRALATDDPAVDQAAARPEPWATLDLDSDATWDEVVARHRELAKQHHPDRAGADQAAAAKAAERMAEINAAFAELGTIYRITGDR
ncbi:MAG TPA: J domain-containing protein [Candidatus Nanopelagicales bacterium]|nr:J domain-containing protein [Candidatus Nanopelagicales bacterium]